MERKEFSEEFESFKSIYPFAEYEYLGNKTYPFKITNDFEIIDEMGNHWGTFRASIYFHFNYPRGFAVLVDESKSFPWTSDWHIDENGECCVCNPIETIEMESQKIDTTGYVEKYLIPFYANQVYKQQYGTYKNGDYAHSLAGMWESLEEELQTNDRIKIKTILKEIRDKPGRNSPCYCGSYKKLKHCHIDRVDVIKKLINQMDRERKELLKRK